MRKLSPMRRYQIFFVLLGVFCLAAILVNLVVRRGPVHDATIENDLRIISSNIDGNVANGLNLPASLTELTGLPVATAKRLSDYDYTISANSQYQLCATFLNASQSSSTKPYSNFYGSADPGVHGKGRQCFQYKVHPAGSDGSGRPVPMAR